MKSVKETALDKKIIEHLKDNAEVLPFVTSLMQDEELQELQEYANIVSIRRLGYNDHGPVHMRQVALNAIKMLNLLKESGINPSLLEDCAGTFDDSLCATFAAAFMHDIGMSIGREGHERMSCILAVPILDRILAKHFNTSRRTIIKSVAMEGIIGHMATQKIHSIEAGTILVADGCDMQKGRARIPMAINTIPRVGDIHKISANSIIKVKILKGNIKPIIIDINMDSDVGFFQVEGVLIPKVEASPIKKFIEIHAGVNDTRRTYEI